MKRDLRNIILLLIVGTGTLFLVASCARMGAPDGGWYDETPPRVIGASPADHGTGVTQKRISIYFDEFIKLENASEKVVISPPQMEQPEIKAQGKRIVIELIDTLKPATTYTVDFSDAIVDNNESNPMGNYTYTFSTGEEIDTLECSGYVLNAENLEPIKGILVGLSKTAGETFLRVSRTDSRGHFIIRGIAPGSYTVGAVQDVDGDYRYSQRAETMAFSTDSIRPHSFLDHRQDTIWADALHIKDIVRVPFTHHVPDNIVLRAFTHQQTDRNFLKYDRKEADHFTLFFTAPLTADSTARFSGKAGMLPSLRMLNAPEGTDENHWYVHEHYAAQGDTVTYWLRDSTLINRDTLLIEMTTLQTDTAGTLQLTTDTLEVLAKTPLAKRLKQKQQEYEDWHEDMEKRLKNREKRIARMTEEELRENPLPEIDTVMPVARLIPRYDVRSSLDPNGALHITLPTPLERIDTAAVHLYVEQDSLWFRAPCTLQTTDTLPTRRNWEVYSEWIPGARYSFEIDTLAFEDIYGKTSEPFKAGFQIRELNDYASLFVNITEGGSDTTAIVVQLLNGNDAPVMTATATDGTAEFYYINPGKYFMRAFIDRNGNGKWDTGDFYNGTQPEEVYYYTEEMDIKAKWDYTKQWTLNATPLYRQKPSAITKQKADKEKTIKNRNADRAREKGVPVPER